MATQLLTTKLHVPPTRPGLVSRPHLIERLNADLDRKLTLVSAPAGYGKTTLVTEWLHAAERPFAWLAVDEDDNDPVRFLTYLVLTPSVRWSRQLGNDKGVMDPPRERVSARLHA